jgi:KaiC/GvpD/RAD55 family RecA-like ATPase
MSSTVRLPSELTAFLSLNGPQTVLVRGPPGSGKSTLCLALLEAAQGERLLISNRVSSPELHREFPWLGDNGSHGIEIVDTSSPDSFLVDSVRAAARSAEVVSDSTSERHALEEFLLLPPPIQEAWSRIPADRPSLIVIDSWDALVEQYLGGGRTDGVDRAEIERMLLRRMSRTRAHLVLVLERKEETHLDYLVNAVVVTERDYAHDRLERWLRIPKMRGIRVANASYPYTVEGAKFQCIEPIQRYSEIRPGRFDPEPDAMPEHLWPGSANFAGAFGRLPVGRSSLFETDDDFPDSLVQVLLGPAIGCALARGGRVVLIPSPALAVAEIWESLASAVPRGRIAETLRVVDVTGQLERNARSARPELSPAIVPTNALLPSEPSTAPDDNEVGRFLRGSVKDGVPGLVVAYLSGLKSLASGMKLPLTPDVVDAFPASVQTSLGSSRLHLVSIGGPESLFFDALKPLAAIHIKLGIRLGRAFLYGAKPWTPGYVLTDATNGGPYGLLRIV